MPSTGPFPVLNVDNQISYFSRLRDFKELYFFDALQQTVQFVSIANLDLQLAEFASMEGLQILASYSIRGEVLFPVPLLLKENPRLLGYYRLMLGFSQKEFYSKGPFGRFKSMEIRGTIPNVTIESVEALCHSLCASALQIAKEIQPINPQVIGSLQTLTIGPQLRGSQNNTIGQIATGEVFQIVKSIVEPHIKKATKKKILILNTSSREVEIKFSADPDIEIIEKLTSRDRGLISIEIKGGKDKSNIHNRIGEAEKSHQKAKNQGYFEFMTIHNVDIDNTELTAESPTTSHFFHLDLLKDPDSEEYKEFSETLCSIISI